MCGRFTDRYTLRELKELYDLTTPYLESNFPPRYNIAPTQKSFVVRLAKDGKRELAELRWGLVPSWAKDLKIGSAMINAKAALGCQDAQGWLFGRPLDANSAEALLRSAARAWPAIGTAAKCAKAANGVDGVQRRLAAIVAADIVGYSRMMAHDEVGTVRAMSDVRDIVDPMIAAYRGRIVDTAGDSYMLEFASVVDAVSLAVAVQRTMEQRNALQAENRRMEFRIGINLGDIIVRGADIYGDGVNIAARLETLAMPGGICVFGKVYDDVAHKLALRFEEMGPQQLKNIDRPIRAYRAEARSLVSA
jgi:class 3 adenylate cyclase